MKLYLVFDTFMYNIYCLWIEDRKFMRLLMYHFLCIILFILCFENDEKLVQNQSIFRVQPLFKMKLYLIFGHKLFIFLIYACFDLLTLH